MYPVKLAALLFALLCGTAFLLWYKPSSQSSSQWSAVELRILDLTNAARQKAHLSPLRRENVLHTAAMSHSEDMLDRHFFDHVNPSGESPEDRISRIHRTLVGTAGENIWDGSGDFYASNPDLAAAIMNTWMRSAGHRANILQSEFTHLGVGVVMRGSEVRATQDFARIRAYLDAPLPERVVRGTPVDLSTGGAPPPPELFDLKLVPEAVARSAMHPLPIKGARFDATPGRYRLRLYFPSSQNEFEVFSGPSVLIGR